MSGDIWHLDLSSLVQEDDYPIDMDKKQLLANMSHEMRTPIIGIMGSLDWLEQSDLNQQQLSNISTIRECSEELLQIIDNILDVSKINAELPSVNLELCHLTDLIVTTVSRVENSFNRKGLDFRLMVDSELPTAIMLDKIKLQKILLNLLYNSIKFTPEGVIELIAKVQPSDPSRLLISIRDTGVAMPVGFLKEAFRPFAQADSSDSRRYRGTGLGLYICKKLVEIMEGEINISSQNGVGTIVHVSLPLKESEEHIAKVQNSPGKEPDNHSDLGALAFTPFQVLLVEDNPLNQRIIGQMLYDHGFEVTMAANGLDALNILQDKQISIVLMDMQMPIMDGYKTSRLIREQNSWKDIPIIAMTAHSLPGDREKCLASGCSSYIAKPFNATELLKVMKEYIRPGFKRISSSQQLINDLLPEFLALLDEMLESLEIAISNRDIADIQSISHDIKGTAGMYGFMEFSRLAKDIELASRIKDLPGIKRIFSELYGEVTKVKIQVS